MRPAGTRGVRVPAGWRCSAVGALAGGATPVCRAFASCCCRGALHLQVQQRSMPPAREMAWALPPPQAPRLAAATAAARLHPRRILSLGGGGGARNGGVSGRAWRRAASEERVLPLTLPLRSSQPAARRFFSSATSKRARALFCEVLAALRAHFLISSLAAGTLLPNGRFLAAACGHRRSSSSSDHDAHSTRPSSRLHFVGRPTPQPPRAPRAPLLLEPLLNPPRRARRCPCSTARARVRSPILFRTRDSAVRGAGGMPLLCVCLADRCSSRRSRRPRRRRPRPRPSAPRNSNSSTRQQPRRWTRQRRSRCCSRHCRRSSTPLRRWASWATQLHTCRVTLACRNSSSRCTSRSTRSRSSSISKNSGV